MLHVQALKAANLSDLQNHMDGICAGGNLQACCLPTVGMFAEKIWEVGVMSSDEHAFALLVLDAFRAAGHHTDDEIVEAGGPSTTTLTKIRKVAHGEMAMSMPRNPTLRKIDAAAGWEAGSARDLWLTGKAPKLRTPARGLRDVLGGDATPTRRQARPRRAYPSSIEEFVEELADQVLELEERIDLLENEVRGHSDDPPGEDDPYWIDYDETRRPVSSKDGGVDADPTQDG